MTSRLDKTTTPGALQPVFFSDFFDNFTAHPSTGQLSRVTNEKSVKQALKNLLLTEMGERPFQPNYGGSLRSILFDPVDSFTSNYLSDAIQMTIFNHEPRVTNLNISVKPDYANEAYNVTVQFTIINIQTRASIDLTLERVR